MSDTQTSVIQTISETRISGYPLPGWRLAQIESLPRALDGAIGWSVILERTLDSKQIGRVNATSIAGVFDAWDRAIRMAKDFDKDSARWRRSA